MDLYSISKNFPDEIAVTNYFEYVRWGHNIRCSHCGSTQISKRYTDFRYKCNACKSRFSVTTGTHIENTNLPLIRWLMAFALITDTKKGMSAKQLERNLGVSYPTAWSMYRKIRTFMTDETVNMIEKLVFNCLLPPDFTSKDVDSKMIKVRIGKKRVLLGNE